MPALGRPFTLGMLYDCREDSIVPGITLWDLDHLRTDTATQVKPDSELEIVASESIEDKSSALNVEAALKAGFLCGLVEVDGSAKYLNDQKSSKYQARVTLKYKATTRFEELTMKHLGRGNVKHPDVFDKGLATHVVTGILYGAQAFFVFDCEMSKSENEQDVQGDLQLMIKKIPSLSIEGKGALKMSDEDKAKVEKFSCKFYGDFNLEKSPVTFADAVEVYQTLPKLLGDHGNRSVPVKVWLLPLTALDSAAARLVREISVRLVKECQHVLEDFHDLELSAPRHLQVVVSSSEMSIKWQKPDTVGENVALLGYVVEFARCEESLEWNQKYTVVQSMDITGLQPGATYAVRVHCDCGLSGRSKDTDILRVVTTRREFERLAEHLVHNSKKLKGGSFPPQYKLPVVKEELDIDGCRMFSLGKESTRHNRTVMVMGATGSGKSTLINAIVNYIAGVEFKDNFRLKLVHEETFKSQAESQTSEVTVYKLYHQEGFQIPFSLTLVDTPGFGDSRGVQRDEEITEQIRKLFNSSDGVSQIDAVCFVVQAALARLTHTQRYVFDSVLSIFGKDVAENILMLVTFADGQQPPVLAAINAARFPYPKNELGLPVHFKFNNSVLFSDNREAQGEDDNFEKMFWRMGTKSMRKFLTELNKMETKSLQMTKEVLKERRQLETAVEGLQPQVKAGLAKLQEIRATTEQIKDHEAAMTSNENHVIEIEVTKPVQVPLNNKGEYLTNCQACHVTCHYPCAIKEDNRKDKCNAMDRSGKCTVCPGYCHWSVHLNQPYKWEYVAVKQKQTIGEMKEKYSRAKEEKISVQQLIQRQEEEVDRLQDMVVSLIDQSAHSLTRLSEIALRPNPLSAPDYIQMMIDGEKSQAQPGYKQRIQALQAMKDKATIISQVSKKDIVRTAEESREQLQPEKKKKLWTRIFQS
uniref:Fibronectin type-III domain-containing protein n=1 Tax=Knipowitschia caucasica TaxID=637954 RepID=A0AAV2MQR0_KNICA